MAQCSGFSYCYFPLESEKAQQRRLKVEDGEECPCY